MSRCTGHCCRKFFLPFSPDELIHFRRAADAGVEAVKERRLHGSYSQVVGPPIKFGEADKIARMAVPVAFIHARDGKSGWQYGCKHLDAETGDCNDYENRPQMCREYPYGEKCKFRGCTMKECP